MAASISRQNSTLRVFGVPLIETMSHPSQKGVPTVLKRIILHLHKRGLAVDGLFRKMPVLSEFESVRHDIDKDFRGEYPYETLDPHMLATLLKAYLKELPDPLFTHKLYADFIRAENHVDEVRRLIQRELPVCHRALAEVLFLFFTMVAGHSSSNNLNPFELAMIFGPLLIRPAKETPETLAESAKRAKIVQMIITNFDKVFPKAAMKKTIVRRQDTPEILQQKQKLSQIKAAVREQLNSLSQQLVELTSILDQTESVEDVAAIVQALKGMRHHYQQYYESRRSRTEANGVSKSLSYICTSAVESGHTSLIGRRPTLEDEVVLMDDMNSHFTILSKHINRSLYAVFDGHAGSEASKLAAELLPISIATDVAFEEGKICDSLRNGILKTDQMILEKANASPGGFVSGTTAVVCLIVGETLYIANVGDSEAVIGRRRPDLPKQYEPMIITLKHKPTDEAERERITKAGAAVFRGRIFGKLAVSRALGDCEFKPPKAKAYYVTAEPYTNEIQLDEAFEFIVLACDGLWDKVSYQECVDIVGELRKQGKSAEEISTALCNTAISKGSLDNVTAVVVMLNWHS